MYTLNRNKYQASKTYLDMMNPDNKKKSNTFLYSNIIFMYLCIHIYLIKLILYYVIMFFTLDKILYI